MIEGYIVLLRAHAPLLAIAVPLAVAALTALIASPRVAWVVASFGALTTAMIAVDMAGRILLGGTQPLMQEGVGLGVDAVGAFGAAIVSLGALLAVIAAGATLKDFGKAAPFALATGLAASAAWSGVVLARDFVGLFVGAQAGWLAVAGVVALAALRDRAGLNGALRMLSAGGVSAALMLLGIGLLATSINGVELSVLATNWHGAPISAATGLALISIALAICAAIAPLHAWAPISYARGGAFAGLLIGTVASAGALCGLARLIAFGVASPEVGGGVSLALSVLGGASVLVGSAQAVGAASLRRLAAYAVAVQGGCILLGIALGSPAGFEAAFVQLFGLVASVLALIGGAAAAGGDTLGALDGLGRRAPLASVAITAGALSLMGAPLSIGFLGRWRLIEAALGVGWWWVAAVAIAASLAGVFYGGRLIERLYFRRASTAVAASRDPWRFALAPALLSAIAAVALGLQPIVLLHAAESASQLVLGRAE
ncbi:MAG TPA: proton-conducting transporter membrane subunit [Vitreimonas sp.]|nr:proton-conducting transporter membrane subunit [Vitreimonas sp.]